MHAVTCPKKNANSMGTGVFCCVRFTTCTRAEGPRGACVRRSTQNSVGRHLLHEALMHDTSGAHMHADGAHSRRRRHLSKLCPKRWRKWRCRCPRSNRPRGCRKWPAGPHVLTGRRCCWQAHCSCEQHGVRRSCRRVSRHHEHRRRGVRPGATHCALARRTHAGEPDSVRVRFCVVPCN